VSCFHVVEISPWPLLSASSLLGVLVSLVVFIKTSSVWLVGVNRALFVLILGLWWRDVDREVVYSGAHTSWVQKRHKLGFLLFIRREVIFFFRFFWRFFHNSLSPDQRIGCQWPPLGITPLNTFQIPLLNTAILLLRGLSITWSHHSLTGGFKQERVYRLVFTVILGFIFMVMQAIEYHEASFTLADRIYGRTFFLLTGFHGLHVIVGGIILRVSLLRILKMKIRRDHHLGILFSIWYWHFVDVVWLFLFICIYWWANL